MLGKKERPLSAQLPISAGVVGRYDIVVGGDVGIDRLVTDLEDAPDAAADGHRPAIIVIGLPIGGDEGTRSQVPALGQVIVEEGLQGHGIHVSPVLIASKGPDVKDQEASRYVQRSVRQEDDKVGSGRPFLRPEQLIRRSWKLKHWPNTPHQAGVGTELDRLFWRNEKFCGEVAQAELGVTNLGTENLLCGSKLSPGQEGRLIDHWQDWAGDQVPGRVEVERIDWLNIQDVLCVVGVADVKVCVVLKRETDQIANWVLRRRAQIFSLLGMTRRCRK